LPTAEYNLGMAYYKGHGVSQDYAQAIMWLRKAAEHGAIEAERTLGAMYWQGKGVLQDGAQAAFWYRKAADKEMLTRRISLAYSIASVTALPRITLRPLCGFAKLRRKGMQFPSPT
jgi:hypothetical protein